MQIISELYNSRPRPKPFFSLCRRTLSRDIDCWRDQRRKKNGHFVTSLENCSELYPLCTTAVLREKVCILIICLLSQIHYLLFTWLILSILRRIYPSAIEDLCVAIGTNNDHVTQSIFLQPVLQNCDNCYRCFVETSESKCSVSSFIIIEHSTAIYFVICVVQLVYNVLHSNIYLRTQLF